MVINPLGLKLPPYDIFKIILFLKLEVGPTARILDNLDFLLEVLLPRLYPRVISFKDSV